MSKTEENAVPGRIIKGEFLERVSRRAGLFVDDVSEIYDAMVEEILEITGNDGTVLLTGFGSFYPQRHKGHQVQFSESTDEIPNYAVLKFSAAKGVNRDLGARLGVTAQAT